MKITFSHQYPKLSAVGIDNEQTESNVVLIEVLEVDLENLSWDFIRYDTRIEKTGELEYYPLPKKGKFLLLIFENKGYGLFTTLRRSTPNKLQYYKQSIGQPFFIEFKD